MAAILLLSPSFYRKNFTFNFVVLVHCINPKTTESGKNAKLIAI